MNRDETPFTGDRTAWSGKMQIAQPELRDRSPGLEAFIGRSN
ncbi:hypothetical protein QWJ46_17280 [Rhizobium sp. CBN3]|nr:hypothetical protein [Rhizobium sp. CBN3]MDO3434431.1 hypothetical protein [Rhizobium sp. CBN3]